MALSSSLRVRAGGPESTQQANQINSFLGQAERVCAQLERVLNREGMRRLNTAVQAYERVLRANRLITSRRVYNILLSASRQFQRDAERIRDNPRLRESRR